jgi:hypothetical protein
MLPQEGCGVGRDAETGLEELVVGLRDGMVAGFGKGPYRINGWNVTILTIKRCQAGSVAAFL